MGWESSSVVGFDLGPLLEGQMRTAKLKSAYNLLIIGPRGFGALSLRWIQFASVFRCARSSYLCLLFECTFCNIPATVTIETSFLVLQMQIMGNFSLLSCEHCI